MSRMHSLLFRLKFAFCLYFNIVIAIDVYYVDDSRGYGRRFDGMGGMSAGVSSKVVCFSLYTHHAAFHQGLYCLVILKNLQ